MATQYSLYDQAGKRKYLTHDEVLAFLRAAEKTDREVRTLCFTLAYTGCRITEALELTVDRVDFTAKMLTFRTLKKHNPRKPGENREPEYRSVPIPDTLLDALDLVHNIRQRQRKNEVGEKALVWRWKRTMAYLHIKAVMAAAGIGRFSPKSLRHAFGVYGVTKQVSLNMLQKWLGHSQITTTAIYADASGEEERKIASTMW